MKQQTVPTLQQALSNTLFGSGAIPQNGDAVIELDPSELTEITDQPFRAYDSEKLSQLADSIQENGQQEPCIVRKKDGKYIILAGRNRKRACASAGCKVKCIVRECSDAEANLILTDTNLYQRHELLPSELAAAYAMQKAAYESKGERKSTAAIANTYGETVKTIQRYIKLNDLDKALMPFVDEGRIPAMAGVILTGTAYPGDQQRLAEYLNAHPKLKISMKQAEDLLLLEKEHCWYSDILDDFFAGKFALNPTHETLKPAPMPIKHEPAGTLYICKCGKQIRKGTNSDTTGNRLENFQAGHECWNCPYVCPVYKYQEKPNGIGYENAIVGHECRMSKKAFYVNGSWIQSYAGDTSNSYIFSLDLDFLARVETFADTLDGGIVGCEYNAQRGADYRSDGRLCMTITYEKNKKGNAAKQTIVEQFFRPDGSRLDMTSEEETQLVLCKLREACPTAPGLSSESTGTVSDKQYQDALNHIKTLEVQNKSLLQSYEVERGKVEAGKELEDSHQTSESPKEESEATSVEHLPQQTTYQRMTQERCNGIKSGYWSPNTKEELVQRLAEYENAYPDGPKR